MVVLLGRPTVVLSPNRHAGRRRPLRLLVVHTTESGEQPGTAVAVATWFARTTTRASAHYVVDARDLVQCVAERDTAWAAPGANSDGLQIELCGRAGQTGAQWQDAESRAIVDRCARLVGILAHKYDIPIVRLAGDEIRSGAAGVVGHADVNRVYRRSTHWDPGPKFPWSWMLRAAAGYRHQKITGRKTARG
jgi:N-acetyl-anhydromuramyl-L-alanine amidase AmpD